MHDSSVDLFGLMTGRAFNEEEWIRYLVLEAQRDLAFVFNITAGAFGGPKPPPPAPEIPALLERISAALIAAGCVVGFGDLSTGTWTEAERLKGLSVERLPGAIASYYAEEQDEADFLTFTIRPSRESSDA